MSEIRIIKKIGSKLREESRDVVGATLPARLHELLERLADLEREGELDQGRANRTKH